MWDTLRVTRYQRRGSRMKGDMTEWGRASDWGGDTPATGSALLALYWKDYNQAVGSRLKKRGQVCEGWTVCVFWQIRSVCVCVFLWVLDLSAAKQYKSVLSAVLTCFFSLGNISVALDASHSISFSLSEGARAAKLRVRREICWINNLRSSTTSLTPSLIQRASCGWCPETTCSTGRAVLMHITSMFLGC